MNLRKLGVAGLVSALLVGLSGVAATSAAAYDPNDSYATLTGKVTYNNKPVKGVNVSAQGPKDQWGGSATTDASGVYTINWVNPGTYSVRVDNWTYSSGKSVQLDFLATYSGNTVRGPDATTYKVEAGTKQTVNIKAVTGASVKGKVVDSKGKPVKGAWVSAANSTRYGYGYVETDAKGNYVVKGLASGRVDLSAGKSNKSSSSYGSVNVSAKAGKTASAKVIKLKTYPEGTLTGTVKGLKKGDTVWVYDTKLKYSFHLQTATKSTVKIKQKLAPGTYRLVVGGTNVVSKAVTVKAKKTAKAGTLNAPKKRTKVSGTIKGANGKALANASVWVNDSYGTNTGYVQANAKGKYSISGVVSGKYTVSASDPKGKSAFTSSNLTVKKGKNATKSIRLGKTYKVSGTVKYKGKAVAGVIVHTDSTSAETSSKGKFTLQGLAKGKQRLSAYDPYTGGYLNTGKSVSVKKNFSWNFSLKK